MLKSAMTAAAVFPSANHNRRQGIKHIDIADGFKGEIDLASALALQKVEVGAHAAGSINLSGCPSIQAVKFEEDFSGRVDLRNSGVIYVRAKDGCSGRFVLLHCENLSLLRLPRDKRADIAVERMRQSSEPTVVIFIIILMKRNFRRNCPRRFMPAGSKSCVILYIVISFSEIVSVLLQKFVEPGRKICYIINIT